MTKIGLRSWLLLCSLLPALLVSVFCAGYFSYVRYQELALSFSQRAQHIALPLSISSQDLLSRQNTAALEQLLSSAHRLNSPLVSNISLFDTNHQPLIHTNPQQFSRALQLSSTQKLAPTGLLAENVNELVFYQPLPTTDDSGIQGYLLLQLPKAQLQLQQQQL
ncbi:MAG: two-component system sensor histidine kinase BarA, partial [Rheinheimera aquimaris]